MYFLENLVECLCVYYTARDQDQVITSVRPAEEFDLEIHNFDESREYKAARNFCLDIGRHVIDTRAPRCRETNKVSWLRAHLHYQLRTGAFRLWASHSMAL